ncbi:MAG TPA: hypothetical protein VHA09_07515 [Nitrososphaera sp.]|nr:hypothetical protein [Nitrososphaera sp.]
MQPWKETEFKLKTVANVDMCNISFDQSKKQLHIGMSGPTNETGFFQIAPPHKFLGGPYMALVEGHPVEFKSAFSIETGMNTTTTSVSFR